KKLRRDLPPLVSPSGERSYSQRDVEALIARTATDLDLAILESKEPGLDALRDWATWQIDRLRTELDKSGTPSSTAHWTRPVSPYPVAVLAGLVPALGASLGRAERRTEVLAAPPPETISRKMAEGVLDQLADVLKTIFVLAKEKDLQITVK